MWQVDNIVENNGKIEKEKTNNKLIRPNRRDRQEEIKKILIESLISKQKLKKQLKALRDKKIKNEKLINDNLKLTNLDD